MSKLNGKVALVTGASRGLGKGIVRALGGEGASVMMTARGNERLATAAKELAALGVDVLAEAADVADAADVDCIFERLMSRFGRLDVLVNNAAAFEGGPIDELSTEAWDHVIATNLRGPFLCTRASMRIMKRQGGGRIINIGSISAQRPRFESAPYTTSKFGLTGLTHVTALEGREHGITCGCLHPGNILVERREEEQPEPMTSIKEIADVVRFMATLPPHVQMLESIVLPRDQLYLGRG